MDRKIIVIAFLLLVIVGLCVWVFGFRNQDNKQLEKRLEDSIVRAGEFEESAYSLQAENTELIRLLDEERAISGGLRETSGELERLYRQSELNYREQREIINGIQDGDIKIDTSISRIEDRLKRSLDSLERLESGSEEIQDDNLY